MEETVRTLLQNQESLDGPKVDPLDLMKAYKDKLLEEMWKQQDSLEGPPASADQPPSSEASGGSEESSKDSNPLLERLQALEAENSALSMENDNQRKQYERCLDEVANQVVQALLTQKDLKEECVKLRTRVFDLEQQNRILSMLFQQRVKMSTAPVSQEFQRNGKAGIPAGRWPSLLSLTCPRSSVSGSGSEQSLSSACSEYSSGSHTWAEGRGFTKQCAINRDKRISAGSVSSYHSTTSEQADLGWKEGHILKGLKRLQMSNLKEASSLASVPHCKDCMTSNEGIYSLGVKCGQQSTATKKPAPTTKLVIPELQIPTLDSDGAEEEPNKLGNGESNSHTENVLLCLENLDASRDIVQNIQDDPVKLFHSPVTDNYQFLESPLLKPGISPTDSLTQLGDKNKSSLEKGKSIKFSDKNNNQERSTERKSRLDQIKRQQGRLPIKLIESGTNIVSLSVQHTGTQALSCMNEARQRSSSLDVPYYRNQGSQPGSENQDLSDSESSQRKPKPQLCDSARKAFILRSKSADAGQDQLKHTHSPLHQKLIKDPKSKGQLIQNPTAHSVPNKRTNLSKTQASSKGLLCEIEKDGSLPVSTSSKSLECVRSPLASPVKHSKTCRTPVVCDSSKSPTKSSWPNTKFPLNNDSIEENIYDNQPCSPRKQRRQDKHWDASLPEYWPQSPPLPPGRSTSLLEPINNSTNDQTSSGQLQSSTTGKIINIQDNQHMGTDGELLKNLPAQNYHGHLSKIIQGQESLGTESIQLLTDQTATSFNENCAFSLLPSQSILQRSQQSISEPKLSEVIPPVYSNIYYHGIAKNPQISVSRAIKRSLPVNAKSHEAIAGQETNTFLIFGRQNQEDSNMSAQRAQSFQTFTCDPQMIHDCGAHEKAHKKIELRCNSLDSEPTVQPVASDSGVMLDWGFDEEGWLFKRSVSVSTRPPLKPVMGMNGAKARSQSFGARYMDRPSFNRSGKVRTQIKTHSGSSLNSLGDVLPGSMSCSSSYHCPMNRSLLNNFLIEEGLAVPSHLGSSSERLQSLKQQREQARRLQIEQQFSSAFGEPVSEEPERQSTITTIEEKVMLGIEENLHKSKEQERSQEVKQKPGSSLANWFGFRKSKLPAPSNKKADPPKAKEEKREQKITSLLGGKQTKAEKKRDRRKSDGKDSSVGRRESHDAVRACISVPCPGMSVNEIQGCTDISGDPKTQTMNRRTDGESGTTVKSPTQDTVIVCKQK
ncbi:uncharacterized protein LOC114454937 isoform X2 [Gouania willdenowi]|uniref:uncharacterized protein LOC114454937 isoform X2 n=1 Tax=Gouania willdenowi TaxID=441366 RepID=UPI0010566EB3|nr:uncharacterized protein LOC114454937 isoform X2 [Gouania willdenowi]